jgi:hypothetical protein
VSKGRLVQSIIQERACFSFHFLAVIRDCRCVLNGTPCTNVYIQSVWMIISLRKSSGDEQKARTGSSSETSVSLSHSQSTNLSVTDYVAMYDCMDI